jgi:hypothetical protein
MEPPPVCHCGRPSQRSVVEIFADNNPDLPLQRYMWKCAMKTGCAFRQHVTFPSPDTVQRLQQGMRTSPVEENGMTNEKKRKRDVGGIQMTIEEDEEESPAKRPKLNPAAAAAAATCYCQCGLPCVRLCCRKGNNAGQFFFKCPKQQHEQCKFFQWERALLEQEAQSRGIQQKEVDLRQQGQLETYHSERQKSKDDASRMIGQKEARAPLQRHILDQASQAKRIKVDTAAETLRIAKAVDAHLAPKTLPQLREQFCHLAQSRGYETYLCSRLERLYGHRDVFLARHPYQCDNYTVYLVPRVPSHFLESAARHLEEDAIWLCCHGYGPDDKGPILGGQSDYIVFETPRRFIVCFRSNLWAFLDQTVLSKHIQYVEDPRKACDGAIYCEPHLETASHVQWCWTKVSTLRDYRIDVHPFVKTVIVEEWEK